jgi:hypothetical protein
MGMLPGLILTSLYFRNRPEICQQSDPTSGKREPCFGTIENERSEMKAFAAALSKMDDFDRNLLVWIAQKFPGRNGSREK